LLSSYILIMTQSEKEIIKGCVKGKQRDQKALYERYNRLLRGVCLRYAKNDSEAEDILFEGFTVIFKKIKTFKREGSFEGWMRKIMVHTAIDNYRRNKKYYYYDLLEDNLNNVAFSVEIPDTFTQQELLETIQELPLGYRTVFNLYVVEGYSHKEIADKLNITISTSKTQLMKAKRQLAKKLQKIETIENYKVREHENKTGY